MRSSGNLQRKVSECDRPRSSDKYRYNAQSTANTAMQKANIMIEIWGWDRRTTDDS